MHLILFKHLSLTYSRP